MNAPASDPTNERFEGVVAELAELIHDGHLWECVDDQPCQGTTCADDKARAVLAYLHGAGLIYWGRGVNPMPSRPDDREPFAVRVQAEFWSSTGEQTPEEQAAGIQNYLWVGGALAVRSGYPGKTQTPTRTFLEPFTAEQRAQLLPVLEALVAELNPAALQPGSIVALMELADNMRARLEYDQRRGIMVHAQDRWAALGWDVANTSGELMRTPSEAVAKLFYAPAWRPQEDELTWFRSGFSLQRKGHRRSMIGGRA